MCGPFCPHNLSCDSGSGLEKASIDARRYEPRSVIRSRPVIDYVRIENAMAELCKCKHKDAPRVCKNREDGAICVAECVNLEELAATR